MFTYPLLTITGSYLIPFFSYATFKSWLSIKIAKVFMCILIKSVTWKIFQKCQTQYTISLLPYPLSPSQKGVEDKLNRIWLENLDLADRKSFSSSEYQQLLMTWGIWGWGMQTDEVPSLIVRRDLDSESKTGLQPAHCHFPALGFLANHINILCLGSFCLLN